MAAFTFRPMGEKSITSAKSVSISAQKAPTITVTTSLPRSMVFRLTPFCRCMGRLSWREHSPQMNRNMAEKADIPPFKYSTFLLRKICTRYITTYSATTAQ